MTHPQHIIWLAIAAILFVAYGIEVARMHRMGYMAYYTDVFKPRHPHTSFRAFRQYALVVWFITGISGISSTALLASIIH